MKPKRFDDVEDDDLPVIVDENEGFISFWALLMSIYELNLIN